MKKLSLFPFFVFVIFSCSNKTNDQAINDTGKKADSLRADSANNSFFPVTSFLKGQMILLDSVQVTFLQVTTIGNQSDSIWVPREKIRPLLQPFIADVIDDEKLNTLFKESKFYDQSTAAITLTYDPKTSLPDSISIRHWDVYINPEAGTVKRLYILKQLQENNQFFTQQLTWQTDKWAKIVTILNQPGGKSEIQSDIKLQWDLTGVR